MEVIGLVFYADKRADTVRTRTHAHSYNHTYVLLYVYLLPIITY